MKDVRIVKMRWRNNAYTGPAWMSFRSATLRDWWSVISELRECPVSHKELASVYWRF